MKNIVLLFVAFLSLGLMFVPGLEGGQYAHAEERIVEEAGAKIEFKEDIHGDASTEFKFTNIGTEPLIISRAKGSCGCLVPSWPREPIQPGQTGIIKVKYDSKRIGPINKSVTIVSNASNHPTKVIRIKGMIEAPPAGGATPEKGAPGLPATN